MKKILKKKSTIFGVPLIEKKRLISKYWAKT